MTRAPSAHAVQKFFAAGFFVAALFSVAAFATPPSAIAPPAHMPARLLRTLAHHPDGYDPAGARAPTDVLLGDLLFHSPRTLGPKAQALGLSCQTCHPNGATNAALIIPGVNDRAGLVDLTSAHFRAGADDGVDDPLDIPSLRGARYTAPYGRDGRTQSLAEFTAGVVALEFGGAPLAPSRLAALVRYEQELDFLPNRNLDEHGRLTARASEAARRGELEFEKARAGFGGMSCASCHVPSSFFRDGRSHRLGTGGRASPYGFDDGFETPTLLGLAESAPYFHDGRFRALADVVAWFDRAYALGLDNDARAALTAYLEAVGAVDDPEDRRPLGRRLVETFAYLRLLSSGESANERDLWIAALELVQDAIAENPPPTVRARVEAARAKLAKLRARAESGAALEKLRGEIDPLHAELDRLAADWTGALAAGR